MYLNILHAQINVPSGCPTDGGLLPLHRVCEIQLCVGIGVHYLRTCIVRKITIEIVINLNVLITDGCGFNFKANHTIFVAAQKQTQRQKQTQIIENGCIQVY